MRGTRKTEKVKKKRRRRRRRMSFVVRTRMDSERFESARGEGDVQLLANLIYEESIITRDVRSSLSLFSLFSLFSLVL
tara:strand:- start:250 stop:483 length:234 start_codon:yes stop_codon:yes gene_type:complete